MMAAILAMTAATTFSASIPMANPSFENPAIATSDHISNVLPTSWTGTTSTASSGAGETFIIKNPASNSRFPAGAADGTQWVQILAFRTGSQPEYALTQNLGAANAAAAGTYTLSGYAGFDATSVNAQNNTGGRVELYANNGSGTPLISVAFPAGSLTPGQFMPFTGNVTLPPLDPALGTSLVVRLEIDRPASNAQFSASVISYDGLRLDFTPVPEPVAGLLALAAGPGAMLMRRRRNSAS
jgi:hypothetical protein